MPAINIDDDENVDWLHSKQPSKYLIYQEGKLMARCNIADGRIETTDSELEEFFYLLVDEGLDNDPITEEDGQRFVEIMERAGYEAKPNESKSVTDAAKASKASVGFEHPAQGPDVCAKCIHFNFQQSQCSVVAGEIQPQDWCRRFQRLAHPIEQRFEFQGLPIAIENPRGSVRSGRSKTGKEWSVRMTYPYGYIEKTLGVDGDEVDCFIGDNPEARYVYVIHALNPWTERYDEDKCMLGFNSPRDAQLAFIENYSDPGFFGSMERIAVGAFAEQLKKKGTSIIGG